MKSRTLLIASLTLSLVMAFAASAFATNWTAPAVASEFTKPTSATPGSNIWNSGPVTVDANSTFNINFSTIGSWDAYSDPNTRRTDTSEGKATLDSFTINIYKGSQLVTSFFTNEYDGGGNKSINLPRNIDVHSLSFLLADAGVYSFQAIGQMTIGKNDQFPTLNEIETWKLNSASVTPIPGAVWLLGSGLMGLMGFKRSRKNAAQAA